MQAEGKSAKGQSDNHSGSARGEHEGRVLHRRHSSGVRLLCCGEMTKGYTIEGL